MRKTEYEEESARNPDNKKWDVGQILTEVRDNANV
jgi:hypothetical protein